jgi:hypothetical protein
MLDLTRGTPQRSSVFGPDLRVVVTRDGSGREEVPNWYAHSGEGGAGFAAGVWGPIENDNRVFVSTADTPHTTKLPRDLRKLVPTKERRTAPTKSAWNPGYLELTVLSCLSAKALADAGLGDVQADDPVEWATLTHQLRFHADYSPLALPLPLHLAKLAAQYVLPLTPSRATEHRRVREGSQAKSRL